MALTTQRRQKIIDSLVGNCDSWKYSGSAEVLDAMSDDQLLAVEKQAFAVTVANAAVEGFTDPDTGNRYKLDPDSGKWQRAKVTNAFPAKKKMAPEDEDEEEDEDEVEAESKRRMKGKGGYPTKNKEEETPPVRSNRPQTFDELMRAASPDVQNRFQELQRIEQAEKDKVIDAILVNVQPADRRVQGEWLREKPLMELQRMASFVPKQPTQEDFDRESKKHATKNKARTPREEEDQDMLGQPTMNWEEVTEDGRKPSLYRDQEGVREDFGGSTENEVSEEDEFRNLSPRMQTRVRNAMRLESEERDRLVAKLTSHVTNTEDEQRLVNMLNTKSVEELRAFLPLATKEETRRTEYFGSGGGASYQSNRLNGAETDQSDMLGLPNTFDYVGN